MWSLPSRLAWLSLLLLTGSLLGPSLPVWGKHTAKKVKKGWVQTRHDVVPPSALKFSPSLSQPLLALAGRNKRNPTMLGSTRHVELRIRTHDPRLEDWTAYLLPGLPPVSIHDKVNFTILMMVPSPDVPIHCGRCAMATGSVSFCAIVGNPTNPPRPDADVSALWYHLPSGRSKTPIRLRPDVPNVGYSGESSVNIPWLNNLTIMRHFDIEHSYRVSSAVLPVSIPFYYMNLDPADAVTSQRHFWPPMPTRQKLNAVVTIISHCSSNSARDSLVQKLMGAFRVDSYGACWNNMGHRAKRDRRNLNLVKIFAKYRFCVAFENSITWDYVTEKVFHGLTAGCLPLYLGAPNVQEFLPYNASRMILDRAAFATDELFIQEIQRLSQDDAAYEEYMTWKKDLKEGKPLHPGFHRYLDAKCWVRETSIMCPVVRVLATPGWREADRDHPLTCGGERIEYSNLLPNQGRASRTDPIG